MPPLTTAPTVNGSTSFRSRTPSRSEHHVITVRSTDNCGAVTDSSFTLVVNKAGTTATIISDTPDPSVVGQNYTVTIAVAPVVPGARSADREHHDIGRHEYVRCDPAGDKLPAREHIGRAEDSDGGLFGRY